MVVQTNTERMNKDDFLEVTVHLKSGKKFPAAIGRDRTFDPTDLTDTTIHRFANFSATTAYIVQGGSIDYIEIQQNPSERL